MAQLDPHGPLLDQIRSAFATGRPATGEDLFSSALEAGVPWDLATRAVAEGVAHHYNTRLLDLQPGSDAPRLGAGTSSDY